MMMNHRIISIFFFFLFLSDISGGATAWCRDIVNDTCKTLSDEDQNIHFHFCTTSLYPAPASRCASLHGLARATIRLTAQNLTDTRCQIKRRLMNKPNTFEESCLKDCLELYSNAIPDVKDAMRSFNSKEFADARMRISAVMDAAVTCEDGFIERDGLVSPLSKRNNDSFQLSAMTLSIIHLIQKNDSFN